MTPDTRFDTSYDTRLLKLTMPKPAKPTPDFPLFAHNNGQWAKKVNGRLRYFGPWGDPNAALARFLDTTPVVSNGCQQVTTSNKSVPDSQVAVKEPGTPEKPYPDFPLFPHASGRWAKKIRGKTHYFGPWSDPHGALPRYLTDKDDLEAGRIPQREESRVSDALTVEQMVILFLDAKKLKVQAGEMAARTWKEYECYGKRMIRVFGTNTPVEKLGPADFKRLRADFQKTHKSLLSIKGDLGKSRLFFNWAGPGVHGQGYINRLPRFGDAFKPPSQSALDREREAQATRILTAAQIRVLLAIASTKMKAMILLGINCGFGNTDCTRLVISKLDLNHGWADFARTKNGIRRRNPLWPETVDALQTTLKTRKSPADAVHSKRVFITKGGQPFHAYHVTHEFEKLVVKAGMTNEEADFYDLRRTCASIGLQIGDDDAMRTIMGHKRSAKDMLGVYNRLQVSDDRLRAVINYIRTWLFTGVAKRVSKESDGDQPVALSEQAE